TGPRLGHEGDLDVARLARGVAADGDDIARVLEAAGIRRDVTRRAGSEPDEQSPQGLEGQRRASEGKRHDSNSGRCCGACRPASDVCPTHVLSPKLESTSMEIFLPRTLGYLRID